MLDLVVQTMLSNRFRSLTSPPSQFLLLNGISFRSRSFTQPVFMSKYNKPEQCISTASSIMSSTVAYGVSSHSTTSPVKYFFRSSAFHIPSLKRLFQTLAIWFNIIQSHFEPPILDLYNRAFTKSFSLLPLTGRIA